MGAELHILGAIARHIRHVLQAQFPADLGHAGLVPEQNNARFQIQQSPTPDRIPLDHRDVGIGERLRAGKDGQHQVFFLESISEPNKASYLAACAGLCLLPYLNKAYNIVAAHPAGAGLLRPLAAPQGQHFARCGATIAQYVIVIPIQGT